jgi:predicted glycoside hydrolase/deacetylase ChbG (UPF0249 family)
MRSSIRCWLRFVGILAVSGLWSLATQAQSKTIAERLGYPADSKLLILHADDLAMAHSVDRATFATLDQGAVSSASIMVPCPWLTEVAVYAKAHPEADLGLHLTLTSEWKTYRWGSVAPRDQVPSLLAPDGYFHDMIPEVPQVTPEDVEREIRAQVERAMQLAIHPTHLDSHMGALDVRPELFAVFVKVAHAYGLPFLTVPVEGVRAKMLSMLSSQDIVFDSLDTSGPKPDEDWMAYYIRAVKALTTGVHQIVVHLGYDDAELQAITLDHPDYGAAWRQRDFNVVTSPEFKKALADNHVILIGWKDLRKLLQPELRK